MANFETISPADGTILYEGHYHSVRDVDDALTAGVKGQKVWRAMSRCQRIKLLKIATDYLFENRQEIGREITLQMGRPLRFTPGELVGLKERADMMFGLAESALADIEPEAIDGFKRVIKREALGVVVVMAPWNYPFLTSINAIIPALVAGNSVILKHSNQTPLVADRYVEAFKKAGLPEGVFQNLFLTHDMSAELIKDKRVDYVAFTGSVAGGQAINEAASEKFMGVGLELGGKDPAYVRHDADVRAAAISLADGAFFNSGQSCCGIERIYIHEDLFVPFREILIAEAKALVLGNPTDEATTLGPMATPSAADGVRQQINDAVSAGAVAHLPLDDNWGSAYLGPQVLTDVTHDMAIMTDETFGPVACLMAVSDDAEAVALMNDSQYGLTASIWSADALAAEELGARVETGTVFLNRCDYLDPALAWTGVKNSGRGCTLSVLGYEHLTRPKSYHLKLQT